jgi:hypothetical protein
MQKEFLAYFPQFHDEFSKQKEKYDRCCREIQIVFERIRNEKKFAEKVQQFKFAKVLIELRKKPGILVVF